MFAPGRHLVRVVSHVLGKSGTGTPHIAVLFEDDAGERITWYGYLSDAAIERTVASLQVLGWDPAAHDGRLDSLNGTDLLEGHEAEIVVEHEVYNEELKAKVKWVNAPGGGAAPMATQDATTFAATMRQKVLSAAKSKASAGPGPAKPAGVGASKPLTEPDDDLPF